MFAAIATELRLIFRDSLDLAVEFATLGEYRAPPPGGTERDEGWDAHPRPRGRAAPASVARAHVPRPARSACDAGSRLVPPATWSAAHGERVRTLPAA